MVRWLCHDLATPNASVMTAIELLHNAKPDAEMNELIMSGAQRLTGRLLRLALGANENALSGAPLGELFMAGLDDTWVDWQFSGVAIGGIAPLVAELNQTRALAVTDDGVKVPQGCIWPDSVAAVFAGSPVSDNRSAVAAMPMATAKKVGKTLSPNDKGLRWA